MRRTSRENAFKLLFEKLVSGGTGEITYAVLTRMMNDEDNGYFNYLLNGIEQNKNFIMSTVKKYSKDFDIDRIYKIDLAILMMSTFEILFNDDVPDKVAVNEAVEIAKIFSTDNSPSFINGILATVIKNKESLLAESQENSKQSDGSENAVLSGDDSDERNNDEDLIFAEDDENESSVD